MTTPDLAAAIAGLDAHLAEIGGCGDGYCVIVRPKGQHTNGGCRCWRDGMKMQRLSHAYIVFAGAVRLALKGSDHE